jgi:creatinine amidohydrolase/Fe(II)-dependent formamide hydrolase-like protein
VLDARLLTRAFRDLPDSTAAVGFGWETQDLHRAGALGNATGTTVEIGGRILAHVAARLATRLGAVARVDLDTWLRDEPAELPNA